MLLSDNNGGEFIADLCRDLYESYGIEERHGLPYKPSTQGSIERSHVETKNRVWANLYKHHRVDDTITLDRLNELPQKKEAQDELCDKQGVQG